MSTLRFESPAMPLPGDWGPPTFEIEQTEEMTVRFLGEDEGLESVKVTVVEPLELMERPGMGSWRLWTWRPWLRFREMTYEFDAVVKNEGEDGLLFTVAGQVTQSVTFHRHKPGDE